MVIFADNFQERQLILDTVAINIHKYNPVINTHKMKLMLISKSKLPNCHIQFNQISNEQVI